jgi:hypothetical protein
VGTSGFSEQAFFEAREAKNLDAQKEKAKGMFAIF